MCSSSLLSSNLTVLTFETVSYSRGWFLEFYIIAFRFYYIFYVNSGDRIIFIASYAYLWLIKMYFTSSGFTFLLVVKPGLSSMHFLINF